MTKIINVSQEGLRGTYVRLMLDDGTHIDLRTVTIDGSDREDVTNRVVKLLRGWRLAPPSPSAYGHDHEKHA